MRGGPNDAIVLSLFHHMRDPAEHTRGREVRREKLLGNAQRQINDPFAELRLARSVRRFSRVCSMKAASTAPDTSSSWMCSGRCATC
jgi:hypothetical protein